jgi:hypothetical protein
MTGDFAKSMPGKETAERRIKMRDLVDKKTRVAAERFQGAGRGIRIQRY